MRDLDQNSEFIRLLTTSQSRLYAYTLSLMGDRQRALDVMQETNIVLWRKAAEFRPGSNFTAWMFKVAYYQVMAHRRKQRKEDCFMPEEALQTLAASTESMLDEDHEKKARRLRHCIEKLPSRQQAFIRRRYQSGARIDQLAKEIGVAASTVKQTLYRARQNLIDCIKLSEEQAPQ